MSDHTEISPFISATDALNHFLLAYDAAIKYPDRKAGEPISSTENTQAGEAIVFLVNSTEGYFNRVIYMLVKNDKWDVELLNEKAGDKFNKLLGGGHALKQSYGEVLVVRNALTHSHIYETERTIDREIIKAQTLALVKDKRWNNLVNQKTYTTHSLKLNAIPSEVCFEDAKKVFKFWSELYGAINTTYPKYGYLPPVYPQIYKRMHGDDKQIEEKLNTAFSNDGSMSRWINFDKS